MLNIEKNETCTEITDERRHTTCGEPITTEVSWADRNRAEYPPTTPENPYQGFIIQANGQIKYTAYYPHKVVRRVCTEHANSLMTWAATHLNPTAKTI